MIQPFNLTFNFHSSYFTNNSKLIHLFIHNESSKVILIYLN